MCRRDRGHWRLIGYWENCSSAGRDFQTDSEPTQSPATPCNEQTQGRSSLIKTLVAQAMRALQQDSFIFWTRGRKHCQKKSGGADSIHSRTPCLQGWERLHSRGEIRETRFRKEWHAMCNTDPSWGRDDSLGEEATKVCAFQTRWRRKQATHSHSIAQEDTHYEGIPSLQHRKIKLPISSPW